MPETEKNIVETEKFIRDVLEKNFNQRVDPEVLKAAAKKLRAALPGAQKRVA
jgi:hypothetical protein